jgi:hypothetical protein
MLAGFLQTYTSYNKDTAEACKTIIGKMVYLTYNNLVFGIASYGTRIWLGYYEPGILHLVRVLSAMTAILYIFLVLPNDGFVLGNVVAHLIPMFTAFIIDSEAISIRNINLLIVFSFYFLSLLYVVKKLTNNYPYTFMNNMNPATVFAVAVTILFVFDLFIR